MIIQYAHRCLGVSVFRGSMFLTWRFIYSGEVKRSGKGQNASGSFSTGDGDTPVQYPAGLRACIWGLSYVSEWVSKDFAAYDTWCAWYSGLLVEVYSHTKLSCNSIIPSEHSTSSCRSRSAAAKKAVSKKRWVLVVILDIPLILCTAFAWRTQQL